MLLLTATLVCIVQNPSKPVYSHSASLCGSPSLQTRASDRKSLTPISGSPYNAT
jgi:hypothetical protein